MDKVVYNKFITGLTGFKRMKHNFKTLKTKKVRQKHYRRNRMAIIINSSVV